ncbi:MAG: type II toxin-antitoxin system HicA family toxin [Pseudomonadota bacterium]
MRKNSDRDFRRGFKLLRSKGSHRIYLKQGRRIIIPFHPGKLLHPKIVKQVSKCLEEA